MINQDIQKINEYCEMLKYYLLELGFDYAINNGAIIKLEDIQNKIKSSTQPYIHRTFVRIVHDEKGMIYKCYNCGEEQAYEKTSEYNIGEGKRKEECERFPRCSTCFSDENISLESWIIESLLRQNLKPYCCEFKIDDLENLRFDFAIFKTIEDRDKYIECRLNETKYDLDADVIECLIEYNGFHHYQRGKTAFKDRIQDDKVKKTQNNDKIKRMYCIEHKIHFIEIPYQVSQFEMQRVDGNDKYITDPIKATYNNLKEFLAQQGVLDYSPVV